VDNSGLGTQTLGLSNFSNASKPPCGSASGFGMYFSRYSIFNSLKILLQLINLNLL
jgi:hypothetical protein